MRRDSVEHNRLQPVHPVAPAAQPVTAPNQLLALQRAAGNKAVAGLVRSLERRGGKQHVEAVVGSAHPANRQLSRSGSADELSVAADPSAVAPLLQRINATHADHCVAPQYASVQRKLPGGSSKNLRDPVVDQALRETTPDQRDPEPTLPGDTLQQRHTISNVDPDDLFALPRIQDRIKTIAEETEGRERATKSGDKVEHTAVRMIAYWRQRFIFSVDYILYRRNGGRRAMLLNQLRAEEDKLVKKLKTSAPADLVVQVESLRRAFKDRWQREVDRAADQYVTIASNEAKFLTINQAAKPVRIYGLPESLEGTVEASAHRDTMVKTSAPVAPSVVEFMKAVQKESALKAMADNYADHEKHSPYVGNIEEVGKYSFDVDLSGLIKVNAEGFYERAALVNFFLAVDRAATATQIAWIAIYNDFEVAKTVNEKLGHHRIGFSGGGDEGSIHHGPAPYILHVHFNIMPTGLAGQYLAHKARLPSIDLGRPQ